MAQEEQQHTQDELPLVSEEVIEVFLRDATRRNDEGSNVAQAYGAGLQSRLERDNPHLSEFLVRYANASLAGERGDYFIQGAVFAYELLRRQANTNVLQRSI